MALARGVGANVTGTDPVGVDISVYGDGVQTDADGSLSWGGAFDLEGSSSSMGEVDLSGSFLFVAPAPQGRQ